MSLPGFTAENALYRLKVKLFRENYPAAILREVHKYPVRRKPTKAALKAARDWQAP